MATFAILTFPAEEIALAETVQRLSNCRFQVEESAFVDDSSSIHVWIEFDEPAHVPAVLDADPSISDYSRVQKQGDRCLYELELRRNILLPREIIRRHGGIVQEAFGSDGEWTFHVRFQNRSDLSAASEDFERYGIDVAYESIEDIDSREDLRLTELTAEQREGLEAAYRMGYYDVPRRTTLCEVAEELGISHQALSERLRRAHEKLTTEHMAKATTVPGR